MVGFISTPCYLSFIKADVFVPSNGGSRAMAEKFNIPFLGSLPLDLNLLRACEDGVCFVDHYQGSMTVKEIVDNLVKALLITENSIIEDIRDVKFAL